MSDTVICNQLWQFNTKSQFEGNFCPPHSCSWLVLYFLVQSYIYVHPAGQNLYELQTLPVIPLQGVEVDGNTDKEGQNGNSDPVNIIINGI